MRVVVTVRDQATIDPPPGWLLIGGRGQELVFERKGATPQDMLFWMQLLERREVIHLVERREVIHLEFTRIDDPA